MLLQNHALQEAEKTGYPVIVKAASGGGGKGIRVAYNKDELKSGFLAGSVRKAWHPLGMIPCIWNSLYEHPRTYRVSDSCR